jgi:hypothetical protein
VLETEDEWKVPNESNQLPVVIEPDIVISETFL